MFSKGESGMLFKDNWIYQFENMTVQLKYLDRIESYKLCLQNAANAILCDLKFGNIMKVSY